jgi:hypothetical protein
MKNCKRGVSDYSQLTTRLRLEVKSKKDDYCRCNFLYSNNPNTERKKEGEEGAHSCIMHPLLKYWLSIESKRLKRLLVVLDYTVWKRHIV